MLFSNKKSSLLEYVPYGLVVTKSWLLSQGLSRHTLDNWVKSGQLTSIVYGVYKRPDTKLAWKALVYSLQRMGSDLCPGGVTALSDHGFGHYVELGQFKTIHLYGKDSLPSWLNSLLPDVTFVRHNEKKLLGKGDPSSWINLNQEFTAEMSRDMHEGIEPIRISSPEKAWFELLMDVPEKISFEHADQLMQGLGTLSPRKLNKLLEACHNVKVRRLFLWFAERHQHAWFKKLDVNLYTMTSGLLGSGKRVLAKGGKLDPKYLITVPEEMLKNEFYG
jgi:hypothetical protein